MGKGLHTSFDPVIYGYLLVVNSKFKLSHTGLLSRVWLKEPEMEIKISLVYEQHMAHITSFLYDTVLSFT